MVMDQVQRYWRKRASRAVGGRGRRTLRVVDVLATHKASRTGLKLNRQLRQKYAEIASVEICIDLALHKKAS